MLVIGWIVAFAPAFALVLVTRRSLTWIALALLALPAIGVVFAIRYGTH